MGAMSDLPSATASFFSAAVVPVTGASPASTAWRALVKGVAVTAGAGAEGSTAGSWAAAAGPEGMADSGVVPGAERVVGGLVYVYRMEPGCS